jgi:signal transduction histidine kinase
MRRIGLLVRRLRRANPLLVDAVVAAVVTALTLKVTHGSYPAKGPHRFDAIAIALILLGNAPLVARRRAPVTVLLVCTAAVIAYEALGYWLGANQLGPEVAYFTLATRRRPVWIVAGAVVIYPEMMYSNVHTWTGSTLDIFAMTAVWLVALGVFGDRTRRLAEHNVLVAAHAAQLQREQRDREQRAVLLERVRIARELHDVVAHHMSVISVQANLAGYVFSSDPATARKALRAVSEMSSEGLDEVRRLVTVLRPDLGGEVAVDAEDQQTPGIDQLPVLIERVGLTCLPVDYTVLGTVQPVPAGLSLCVYRVVQESLTNVIKYARATRVTVSLRYSPQQITVQVTDDGPGGASAPRHGDPTGGGKGLVGMRERATLYGGTLTAGRAPQGGFEVVLTLPIRPAPPPLYQESNTVGGGPSPAPETTGSWPASG